MNLLLDTNAIIWFSENDTSLTDKAKQLIESEINKKHVSIVSFWEMAIKISLGKLVLNMPLEKLATSLKQNGIDILPISLSSIVSITSLPLIHKDPFDRIIVAECITNNYTLISSDNIFDGYGVNRIW